MPVALNLTALTVAMLYYAWRDGYLSRVRRERVLRERIAYMMWASTYYVS
jgi:hypothetical protein